MMFITQPRMVNYFKAKAHRPINLSPFMLKDNRKTGVYANKNEILRSYPLYQNQFTSQPGVSTETALHNVATHIQNAVEQSEIALGAFLGIEEAFDSIHFKVIM